jgi:hypothetical protein
LIYAVYAREYDKIFCLYEAGYLRRRFVVINAFYNFLFLAHSACISIFRFPQAYGIIELTIGTAFCFPHLKRTFSDALSFRGH